MSLAQQSNVQNKTYGDPSQPGKLVVLNGEMDMYDASGKQTIKDGSPVLGKILFLSDLTTVPSQTILPTLTQSAVILSPVAISPPPQTVALRVTTLLALTTTVTHSVANVGLLGPSSLNFEVDLEIILHGAAQQQVNLQWVLKSFPGSGSIPAASVTALGLKLTSNDATAHVTYAAPDSLGNNFGYFLVEALF